MGFSLACSNLIDYHFSSKISHRQTALQLSDWKGSPPLHLKISKIRPQSRRIFSCKIAYTDFDERTSPNEVLFYYLLCGYLLIIFYLSSKMDLLWRFPFYCSSFSVSIYSSSAWGLKREVICSVDWHLEMVHQFALHLWVE